MRFFQSSGPFTLPPGGFETVALAYIFAAPVAAAGCLVTCDVKPGDPTILGDAARMAAGVNALDSIAGYRASPTPTATAEWISSEFKAPVAGSLLAKALMAQAVFDSRFLVPSAGHPELLSHPGRQPDRGTLASVGYGEGR